MKKNKLLGLLVATGGIVASFATAIAVSAIKGATDVLFTITSSETASDDGEIRYSFPHGTTDPEFVKEFLDKNDNANTHSNYDLTYYQLHYHFNLGATYTDCPEQDYVVGNLKFKFSNVQSSLLGHLKIYIVINGYQSGTIGESIYHGAFFNGEAEDNNFTLSALDENSEYILDRDIAVACSGAQSVDAYFKLDGTEAQLNQVFFDADEAPLYRLDVVWGGASDAFEGVYIPGEHNGWNAADKGYRMVPNIGRSASDGWEWEFIGLTKTSEFKLVKNNVWYGEGASSDPSAPNISKDKDNASIDPTKKYNIYWNGSLVIEKQSSL